MTRALMRVQFWVNGQYSPRTEPTEQPIFTQNWTHWTSSVLGKRPIFTQNWTGSILGGRPIFTQNWTNWTGSVLGERQIFTQNWTHWTGSVLGERQIFTQNWTQICHLYVGHIYQQSHHHKSNCQKASPVCTQICHLYVRPIYQHSHHHKSNCQKTSPATPGFATSMYDPYTSTHTIIRVTAKKRHLLPPDLGPLCMTHIPTLTQS